MEKGDRDRLRMNRVYLVKNLTKLNALLDILEAAKLISDEQSQSILAERTIQDRTRRFLDELARGGPRAYSNFINALKETDQSSIIEALESERHKSLTPEPKQPVNPNTDKYSNIMCPDAMKPPQQVQLLKPYPITSKPHGYIMIVNIEEYKKNSGVSSRIGSSIDVERLQVLFEWLSYKVIIRNNLDATDLQSEVKRFSQMTELKEVDAAGIVILAHGLEHHIIASDGFLVSIESLVSCFTNADCPQLAGKPKLLLIQACRGDIEDKVYNTKSTEPPIGASMTSVDSAVCLDPASWLSLPFMSDCVIVYTTLPGFVSWRSQTDGSWYITHFVDVFREYGRSLHVLDLLTEVNYRLVNESVTKGIKQISQPVNTLTKPFFLSTDAVKL